MRPLEVTTKIGCFERCSYCPQDKLISAYKGKAMMSLNDFKFFMSRISSTQQINFSGFCEPFTSFYCRDMIKYCLDSGRQVNIFTRMTILDNEDLLFLCAMPAHTVFLHNIKNMNIFLAFKNPQTAIFVGVDAVDVPDGWKVITQPIISRAGNNGGSDNEAGFKAYRCGDFRHNQNVLLPNGDILICCMDYSLEHVIGNLYENTLKEIWNGKAYLNFISDLINGRNEFCNKCFRGFP